jgi:excisionase family DNA binding protein
MMKPAFDFGWPRGLSREQAAAYIGVGATKFDEMVATHEMPDARVMGGRVVWDRAELDLAFADLPHRAIKTKAQIALEKLGQS